MIDLKKLEVGFLKLKVSEPKIGLMFLKSRNRFVEVFELDYLRDKLLYREVQSNKVIEADLRYVELHEFVINYENSDYLLHKSQWSINRKNLNGEVLFSFKGNGPVRIWNLTLKQQAELMLKYKNK